MTRIAGGQATCYGNKITILIWPFCFNKGLSMLQVLKVMRKKIQNSKFF